MSLRFVFLMKDPSWRK